VETGVQTIYNYLKRLDSGFCRNGEKPHFHTFYETIVWVTFYEIINFIPSNLWPEGSCRNHKAPTCIFFSPLLRKWFKFQDHVGG